MMPNGDERAVIAGEGALIRWLNTTIRPVRRLVEVVKPISGLRNIGTAQLPMSKL